MNYLASLLIAALVAAGIRLFILVLSRRRQNSDSTSLPVTFLGRKIKPVPFAIAFSLAVVALAIIQQVDVGVLLAGPIGVIAVIACIAGVGFLTYGWWRRNLSSLEQGLSVSTALWVVIAGTIFMGDSYGNMYGWLSVAWAIASFGSWALEINDKGNR